MAPGSDIFIYLDVITSQGLAMLCHFEVIFLLLYFITFC